MARQTRMSSGAASDISGAALSGNSSRRRAAGPPQDSGPGLEDSLREAEGRTLDFPAVERATYVRAMVARVADLKAARRSKDEIREQLPEFARDYQHLFEMVTASEGYDSAHLNMMLAMLDRMGQGSLTHHQATVIVGDRTAKKFVRPAAGAAGQPPRH